MLKDRLREARKNAGLTQKQAAEHLQISESAYCGYETGKRQPDAMKIAELASLYHVSGDFLLETDLPSDVAFNTPASGFWIPVLGRVAAGIPMEAVENVEDYEELPAVLRGRGEYFALRIQGDSMEPRMRDGDIIIVRKQDDCSDGDVAVVLVNGNDATVKKIKHQPGGLLLIPGNPAYEPVYYSNADIARLPVTVLGKVVELRGKL